jgi:hypothetical protein
MRRSFVGGVCGPIGALLLGATTFSDGCAQFDDEGDYEAPAGFTVEHTMRVALSHGAFVRDGGRVLNGAAAGRRERPDVGSGVDRPRLESEFFGTYAEGMRVNASTNPRAYVDVVPEGAAAVPGRVRHDGAVLAFENAFPGVTSAFGANDHKVEEFLTIPSIDAVPSLAYTLRNGPEFGSWAEDEGQLWGYDKAGRGLFALAPPVVEDARGQKVTGAWKAEPVEGGVRITPEVDWASLSFPVLFDPTFETPLWYSAVKPLEPVARAGAGHAFYPLTHNCAVIFGGMGANATPRNDVNVYCGGLWQRGGAAGTGITASATKPTARAYVAMNYVPASKVPVGGIYMFGGYDSTGMPDDFWRLTLGGTSTTTTAVWTRINPPATKTATNWPSPRYLAGMGYTNAGLILYGGVNAIGQPLRDTWLYDGTNWTRLCNNCLEGRYGAAYAQLGTEGSPEPVMFGGYNYGTGAPSNTVQRFTGATWQTMTVQGLEAPANAAGSDYSLGVTEPVGRFAAWAARTSDDNLMIGSGLRGGGCGGTSELTDAWIWNRGQNRWQLVPTSPTVMQPGKRESGNAIFNSATNEVLLFGGRMNCGSTAASVLTTTSRTYVGGGGTVTLTVTCIDTGSPGGPNGNSCDTYRLKATVSGVANDTSPTSMRAYFGRRRGSTWSYISAGCGTGSAPISPNSGTNGFQCDAAAWTFGSIDTGFSVRLRDVRYVASTSGVCGGTNQPYCTVGFAGAAACGSDALPSGNNTTNTCTVYLPPRPDRAPRPPRRAASRRGAGVEGARRVSPGRRGRRGAPRRGAGVEGARRASPGRGGQAGAQRGLRAVQQDVDVTAREPECGGDVFARPLFEQT